MANIFELKEQVVAETPLLLFDCETANGQTEHWSTHRVVYGGTTYEARVLRHNVFEVQTASDQGVDGIPRVSLTLANADSHFSQVERTTGWKGAKVTARFAFFDVKTGTALSDGPVVFQGIANPPEEITEATFRLSAINRMSMQRVLMPQVRIERRCPWEFPATAEQRAEAEAGGNRGRYSRFFRCGYSPDVAGGTGNREDGEPFTICGYTRAQCEQRGMFSTDAAGHTTRRFGGIEFVPSSFEVRSYGERGSHAAPVVANEARYNDFVPLVYGTAWFAPPVVFARNDGNLTHLEVLLGMGEIEGVLKVVVNDVEIPLGQAGADMTATGWYNMVSHGNRTGNFNLDFPGGDPYGSMAYLSVVVPNRIHDGQRLPGVEVLMRGLRLPTYDAEGAYLGDEFTANPAWILLDVLQRCGWGYGEIDFGSFRTAAEYCGESIEVRDLYGNPVDVPRFQCNLALQKRRTAADVIRGIRNGARLFLTYGTEGKLELRVENALALQQAARAPWSNATELLHGGWAGYEFGDGTNGTSGIVRRESGEPAIRVWARCTADTPNRLVVEFQDAFNEYQQDSFSVVDVEDVARSGQEIAATVSALGLANFDQAARILKFHLDKSIQGNTYVEFETSVKAFGLRPGDLIALTYLKEGFNRQPFRVLKIAPGMNYRTATITAQIHSDAWYSDTNGEDGAGGRRQPGFGVGVPRPLMGSRVDEDGEVQFEITEQAIERADGGAALQVTVGFTTPASPEPGGPGIPLVSLAATIGAGGTLAGGQTLYYALSAVDVEGRESGLSFIVRATIPAGGNANTVTLTGLSFATGTTGFRVYRGITPAQMCRIATDQAVAATFMDTGLPKQLAAPPDANYEHANFYWRLEMQPECAATIHGTNTVGNGSLEMTENEHRGMVARIVGGKGAGQERTVTANSATTLTVTPAWTVEPEAASLFTVAEAGWHFGAMAKSSPVQFEIPNRAGAVMEISGRAANVNDVEASPELCTLTRWTAGGATQGDVEVPPVPRFSLRLPPSHGSVELGALSFQDLANTRTVTAATLTLYYWDELAGLAQHALAAAVSEADILIDLGVAGTGRAGEYVQVEREVVEIEEVLNNGTRYRVRRGAHGSTPAAHAAQTALYHLLSKVVVTPFVRGFFGSPASGNWTHVVPLANARVASAELFVTNSEGNSDVAAECFTESMDSGMRTLAGGQFSIQVEGYVAVDDEAAPELVVESARSVRDVFAVVRQAPLGAPMALRIKRDGNTYCELTIPSGATISNVVDGFTLPPLASGARMSLDVRGVGSSLPGSDLTVVIRL